MTANAGGAPGDLETYLSRLEAELRRLNVVERHEILLETRSHVLERLGESPSVGVRQILAQLGSPEEYARQFSAEELGKTEPGTFGRIHLLARGGWRSLLVLVPIGAGYFLAGLAVVIAAWKLLWPDGVGLWVAQTNGEYQAILNIFGTHALESGREVLGYSIVVIGLAVALAVHFLISRVTTWATAAGMK